MRAVSYFSLSFPGFRFTPFSTAYFCIVLFIYRLMASFRRLPQLDPGCRKVAVYEFPNLMFS